MFCLLQICSLLLQAPGCLFLVATIGMHERSGANLHSTFATASLQPEGEDDTRGKKRYGLGKSLCVCAQCSLEAGTKSTDFKAALTGEHHW